MKRRKYKYCVCACVLVYIYYFFGVGDYIYSKSFDEEFDYPLNIDLRPVIEEVLSGKKSSVAPINYYPYRFLTNSGTCNTLEKIDLFILVKSAMKNFGHREAVRQTYGRENVVPGKVVKLLFFLGIDAESPKSDTQKRIDEEMATYKDIIQIDFIDNYYNNTIKTMMSFRWAYEHCSTADTYLFTDDDMYISVKNLLNYVTEYMSTKVSPTLDLRQFNISQPTPIDRDRHMFAGFVFKSAPLRYRSSKWRVSLEEYPWNRWPPYVTAGAYIVSNKSMKVMYVGSLFVKHFRFDDIFVGLVAKKVGIEPTHCSQFYFYKKKYTLEGYRNVIASHGYGDHSELVRVWNEQNGIT